MVRFARAKGSKASNERLPEEPTSWKEMKQQMVKTPAVKETAKVEDVLVDLEDGSCVKTTWAMFEKSEPKKAKRSRTSDVIQGNEVQDPLVKNVKLSEEKEESQATKRNEKGNSVKERKIAKYLTKNKFERKLFDEEKKNFVLPNENEIIEKLPNDEHEVVKELSNEGKKFGKKQRKGKKTIQEETSIMYIGGREVEIRKFDGYPIKMDDWVRLNELRKKMIQQNVPKEQIQAAMKLERRRAEKALARERKKVCFNCRQPGHMLSECPALENNTFQENKDLIAGAPASGFCFKCGSTEHTHFQCRVVQGNVFKFAKCFVCGDDGHISRQCPDNPRGMYPKGGACNVCGDVTHLRKDCPKYQRDQESAAVTLPTLMDGEALEDLEGESKKPIVKTPKTPRKKVVKF